MASRERLQPSHPAFAPPTGAYLDYGPDLPARTGPDRVFAIARDPETVWAWWEVEGAKVVLLRDIERGVLSTRPAAGPAGGIYFPAAPDRTYVVEVDGRVSNPVRTPRRGPASEIDPDWPPTAGQEEMLRALPGQWIAPRWGGYAGSSPR